MCSKWFVGVGGDGFDGCWCGMMVCRCIGGGGGSGMVILGLGRFVLLTFVGDGFDGCFLM